MDFVVTDKKEDDIKTVYINGNLSSKSIFKNNEWLPICIKEDCIKYPEKNNLCKKHLKEQSKLDKGTVVVKGLLTYTWTGEKWAVKCKYTSCTNAALKTEFCKDHDSFKNTGGEGVLGSTADIMNMIMFTENRTES